MKTNILETVMGGVVLLVAGFFLVFAYTTTSVKTEGGITYHARFDRVDGLKVGSDVRMSGVKIGTVQSIKIDPKDYIAEVTISAMPTIKLPKDTSAEIITDGLLGSKYLALVPGGDDENIAPGGMISYTQSSVSLESLIGKMMFDNKSAGKKEETKAEGDSKDTPDSPKP